MKTLLLLFVSLSIYSCSTSPVVELNDGREPASFQTCFEAMTNIMNYKVHTGPAAWDYTKAKDLAELEALYGGTNLILIQQQIKNEDILKNNETVKKLVKAPYKVKKIDGKIETITEDDADLIYQGMANSGVHKNHYCYDPKGTIGFCFGRATIAHMEAIARDIHPDLVKKIWIAGDMGVWGHHVATMVYTGKGWMVLDTNLGRKVDVETWIKTYMPYKKGNKDIMVFITQAGRFGPYDASPYNPYNLFNTASEDFKKAQDFYNGYFHDYFESLDNVKMKPLKDQKKAN